MQKIMQPIGTHYRTAADALLSSWFYPQPMVYESLTHP